jgi:hypothetical protein
MNDTEETISLQPYYDRTDFKVGDMVTCIRLFPIPQGVEIREDYLKYRQVDFVGLIKEEPLKDWFTLWYQERGDLPEYYATFHKSELGNGYQPSWHPAVQQEAVNRWLERKI